MSTPRHFDVDTGFTGVQSTNKGPVLYRGGGSQVNEVTHLSTTLGTRGFFLLCDEELRRTQADSSLAEGRRHKRRSGSRCKT